ncbi:MAG: hypothetical protein M1820_008219 [Bogoriella megaspora]|nr:MAG: hypothetical protein M1820_008219 [Bogoriella megaspora]
MSVIIRERERERERDRDRDFDTARSVYNDGPPAGTARSVYNESTREGPRTFTTVRRYKVPERSSETDRYESETRVVRRERQPSPPDDIREWRIEQREVDQVRSNPSVVRTDARLERDYRIERDFPGERAPSPPAAYRREIRIVRNDERERERERDRDDFPRRLPYDLERYSKSTEFYARPEPQPIIIREPAPQPIIIREAAPQPIVIREREPELPRPREESYEMIERSEVNDTRSVSRREEPPPPAPQPKQEEDYYYERRVREVERPRREEFSDEEWDRRREVHPRESASQYGEDHWSSDEDLVYYKKTGRSHAGSREHSPHHRRHLAEGALAGVAAGELLRRHRKNEGDPHGGHIKNAAAGAAVGVAGAEAVSRIRSRSRRRKDRDRSSDSDSDRGRRHRHRHRHHKSKSRSRSKSRARQLAGLAGVAAVGALAGYALKNKGKNKEVVYEDRGRSRSRVRAGSVESFDDLPPEEDVKHADPKHRNRRVAQAGLATAAVAGLVERARSKSRQRKGERSRSRIRQGIPIAAAGLGGAALAGLYEKNKGKKEEREYVERERSQSRPRERSVPPHDDGRRAPSDPALIEYGDHPIPTDHDDAYYRRDYDDAANYSRRRRGSSASSSPGRGGRSRSHSRARRAAETAAIAGVAGVAAHKATQKQERKRAERERRRREEEAYQQEADHGGTFSPPPGAQPYGHDPNYYPNNNAFPPPPHESNYPPQPLPQDTNPYHPYNPAEWGPISSASQQALPHEQHYSPNQPAYNEPWPHQPATAPPGHAQRDPNDVSPLSTVPNAPAEGPTRGDDGVTTPRQPPLRTSTGSPERSSRPAQRDTKRGSKKGKERARANSAPSPRRKVQFNLADDEHSESDISPMEDLPERTRAGPSSSSSSSSPRQQQHHHRYQQHDGSNDDPDSSRRPDPRKRHSVANGNPHLDRSAQRSRARSASPAESHSSSEETVDLPPRFDRRGRKIPDDPLGQSIQNMLQGRGMTGRLFHRFARDALR